MCISTCTGSHLAAPTPYVYVVPPRTTVYRSTTRNTTMDKSCGTPWNTGTSHGNDPFTSPRPPTSSFELRPFFLSLSLSLFFFHSSSPPRVSHSVIPLPVFPFRRDRVQGRTIEGNFLLRVDRFLRSLECDPSLFHFEFCLVRLADPACSPFGGGQVARRFLSPVLVLVLFPSRSVFFLFFFLENCAFHKLATGGAGGGRGEVGRTRDDRWKLVADGFGNRAGTVELEFFEASLD